MQVTQSTAKTAGGTHYSSCVRSLYIANELPAFHVPDTHKGRPAFLRKAKNYASKRDVMNWSGFHLLKPLIHRHRHTNMHRRRAINALVQAICHYVNLVTWQVEAPVLELTRQCGLNTVSTNGNESISRGSRALQQLQQMGIIDGELVWDRDQGTWTTKYLAVTELFWEMIGLGKEAALKEQSLRFEGVRQGLSPAEAGSMSLTKYRALRKQRSIEKSFEIRRNKLISKREHARARRIAALPLDEQRREVSRWMFDKIKSGVSSVSGFDATQFDRAVTREMMRLQAIATDNPPQN